MEGRREGRKERGGGEGFQYLCKDVPSSDIRPHQLPTVAQTRNLACEPSRNILDLKHGSTVCQSRTTWKPLQGTGQGCPGSGLHSLVGTRGTKSGSQRNRCVCLAQGTPDQLLWHSELSVYECHSVCGGQQKSVFSYYLGPGTELRTSGLAAGAALEDTCP